MKQAMEQRLTTHDAVEAWKVAHRFVLDVYRLSGRLPAEEQHGLVPKLRTAAVKVASNIVEGHARKDNAEYSEHLTESQASLEETKYGLLVARDLGYISEQTYDAVMNDAEAISERLGQLQGRLTGTAAEAPAIPAPQSAPSPQRPAAFSNKKGVREAWGDLVGWLKGNRERQIKNARYDNVWTEESAVTSYLEDGDRKF